MYMYDLIILALARCLFCFYYFVFGMKMTAKTSNNLGIKYTEYTITHLGYPGKGQIYQSPTQSLLIKAEVLI